MKTINLQLVLALIMLPVISLYCQTTDSKPDNIEKRLVLYYNNSFFENSDSVGYYKKFFFNTFPETFEQLVQIYGYYEDTLGIAFMPSPLYDYSKQHLDFMGSLDTIIDKSVYLSKLISVAINGYWQSDGISFFQKVLQSKVRGDLKLSVDILKKYSLEEQKSFWHFFFDGPCLPDDTSRFLSVLKKINPKSSEIAKGEVNKLIVEWEK